jgi:hypothetical protein
MTIRKTITRVRAAPIRAGIKRCTLPTIIATNMAMKIVVARIWLNVSTYSKVLPSKNYDIITKNRAIVEADPLEIVY